MRAAPRWDELLAPAAVRILAPISPGGPAPDSAARLDRVLRRAGLTGFLAAATRACQPVTLVVNDPHRGTDTGSVIDAVMRSTAALASPPRFRLLVATGSHRFSAEERGRHEVRILGRWAGRFRARRWHEARDRRSVDAVGPVRLHRWVARGRFSLAIGSLEPHYFAGVTGAHKTLTIGVMALREIEANHALAVTREARPLALQGNPVFEGVAAALRHLERGGRRLLCVNQILSEGRLLGCTAGRPMQALLDGLPMVRRVFRRALQRPADLVVARVAPPLDRSLYQADKGIKNVEAAVRDDGVILLDASCPDGVGPDRFLRLLEEADDHAAAVALVARHGYVLGDHKAVRLRRLTDVRRVRIGIVSPSLPGRVLRALHAVRFTSRAAAARWAIRALRREKGGRSFRALVVEDAGNMALELRERRPRPRRTDRIPGLREVD